MQRSANLETMGCTWRTAHWRDNLLAVADDPLSQEISCQKGLDLAYHKWNYPGIVLDVQPWVVNM